MRPETLNQQLKEILVHSFLSNRPNDDDGEALSLSETEMFRLWNLLGEELGIDLSLVSPEQRQILFDECKNGKRVLPKEFGSLLWLMYYSEIDRQ
jgi:hypothetical protein